MTIDKNDLLNSILGSISRIDYVKSTDIPNIDLYMDQVTSFMEKQLKSTKRSDDDKVLTKTMINNYAKSDLLPAPIKKKYSKEHLLLLTFIYYFKNIMSMKDIETLLKPITEKYFHSDNNINIAHIYDEVCAFEKERTKLLQKDIELMYNNSVETFSDAPEADREYLQLFSFICSLSLDVYVKQLLIEKLIDATSAPKEESKEAEKDKKKKE
ncbi:MAG: DUF1836 domain-containing protein [Faecalimonas sp.]|nr:DUF1836 domain-containing protein [Faecalimonas sp.]